MITIVINNTIPYNRNNNVKILVHLRCSFYINSDLQFHFFIPFLSFSYFRIYEFLYQFQSSISIPIFNFIFMLVLIAVTDNVEIIIMIGSIVSLSYIMIMSSKHYVQVFQTLQLLYVPIIVISHT